MNFEISVESSAGLDSENEASGTPLNIVDSSSIPSSSSTMNMINPIPSTALISSSEKEIRQCWVCLQTEDEKGADTDWVRPCRCRGSSMYVHQNCIQMWIDEKQKYNSGAKVSCPQCKTEYILLFPPFGGLVGLLELCDSFLYQSAPYACGAIFLGSLYFLSFSYGAITVLQVMGLKEGKETLQKAETLWLLTGLPCIPIALIMSKFIRWERFVLQLWRQHYRSLPFFGKLFGVPVQNQRERSERMINNRDTTHPVSCTRLFTGALLLPTVSSFIGRYLFSGINNNLHRTLLGGFTFIVVKGLLKVYLRQQQYIRQSNRKILDYKENRPTGNEKNHSFTQTE